MLKKKQSDSKASPDALKKKALVCSTEAAAISIGVHVLLILLAGSFVAIRYVQKRDAEFKSANIERPKLERRQLQMPSKAQNLQKKSRRPQINTRMASVSEASFSLPDMSGLGDIGCGFDRSGGDRSLGSMGSAGSLGFGLSGVNFFGVRSKGEKMVFIVDASKDMMEDRKGGFYTYKFAKDRIHRMVDGMRSATLFNAMIYTKTHTRMFQPKLVPATPENKEALKKWFAPVNSTPAAVGGIRKMSGGYKPPRVYEDSPMKSRIAEWVRPVQAAMEQQADNIFVLGAGWGVFHMGKENIMRTRGIESEAEWLANKGWTPEKIKARNKTMTQRRKKAEQILKKENAERKKQGLPPKIVSSWSHYINKELKLPGRIPLPKIKQQFSMKQIIEHLKTVYAFNYVPKQLEEPRIHMVKLIAADDHASETGRMEKFPRAFRGDFEHLRGAKTMENLIKYNDLALDEQQPSAQ